MSERRAPEAPQIAPPSKVAGGLKALEVTARVALRETGAVRALRVLSDANQRQGFDCPGCAWPDPEERSAAEFCENGAKAILDEATRARVDAEFLQRTSIEELRCLSERELNSSGRITVPFMIERGERFARVLSYEQAYLHVAEALTALKSPDGAAFYTSGRTSNEAAFAYQLMVRAFGTNNLPDCSNLCHESSGVALKQTLGIGKGTVRLRDFELADLIVVVGQNPGTNHPRMLSALRSAKQRGCKIVSINPLKEVGLDKFFHPQEVEDWLSGGVELADRFVQVKVGGDQALFRALNKLLLTWEEESSSVVDWEFVEQHTEGIDDLRRACDESDFEQLSAQSGVSFDELQQLGRLVLDSQRVIVCWAMGLTQHENSVDTICEVVDFLLLRGNMGRPGAGACPVRGHSNVQGDRTVGIVPQLPPAVVRRIESRYGIAVPRQAGLDSVGTLQALRREELPVFVSLGGNFLSACPDPEATQRGMARCRLVAHIATKLNRSHLVEAERTIVIPCLGRTELDEVAGREQFVSVENSMGVVHASRGGLPPRAVDLRGEPRIVCELATHVLSESAPALARRFHGWARDYDRLRDEIEASIPGFQDYNERVREPGGFELENGPRERRFTTPSEKARFVVGPVRRIRPREGELILMTLRSHDQFNTTVYSDDDRYRGISRSRRVLLMHPSDLEARGIESGDRIVVSSHFEEGKQAHSRQLRDFFAVSYHLPQGCAAAYFPEANPLVSQDSFAAQSRTPTSKSIRISVEKQG